VGTEQINATVCLTFVFVFTYKNKTFSLLEMTVSEGLMSLLIVYVIAIASVGGFTITYYSIYFSEVPPVTWKEGAWKVLVSTTSNMWHTAIFPFKVVHALLFSPSATTTPTTVEQRQGPRNRQAIYTFEHRRNTRQRATEDAPKCSLDKGRQGIRNMPRHFASSRNTQNNSGSRRLDTGLLMANNTPSNTGDAPSFQ